MKDLVIRLKLDRSQAAAAQQAHIAATRKMGDAARDAADVGKKATKELLNDEQVAEKAKQQLIDQTNRKRIDAARKAMAAAHAEQSAAKDTSSSLADNVIGLGKVAAGYGALQIAGKAVGVIAQMWAAQRKDIEDSVDRLVKYREQVLELAALKDRLGQTTPELGAQIEFRAKTLQTQEQARALQEGALNTGQAAMASGSIDRANFQRLMEYAGTFQAATGANPDAVGNLAGMMPGLTGGKNQSAEDVFRRMQGIFNIIQKGGSNLGSGISQFANNSGLSQMGLFASPEQQAAVQSYFSLKAPLSAGTRVDQLVRATVGAQGRMKGSGVEGDEKQMEYLARIGTTNQMDPVQITDKIAEDLRAQEAAAAKQGLKFNAYSYLGHHGYANIEDKSVIADLAMGLTTGQFDKTFGSMATPQGAPTIAEAMDPLNRFKAVDPVAQARKTQIARDAADATRAMGPEEFYEQMRRQAFERLRGRGEMYGNFDEWDQSAVWRGPILDEARRMMEEKAARAGVKIGRGEFDPTTGGFAEDEAGILGGGVQSRLFTSEATRARAYYGIGQRIKEAGGDPMDLKELVGLMKDQVEATKRVEAAMAKGVPAFVPPANQRGAQPIPPPLRGAPPVPAR